MIKFHEPTPTHPTCTFFEAFPATADPYDDNYCVPYCHMLAAKGTGEVCLGNYLNCPIRGKVELKSAETVV